MEQRLLRLGDIVDDYCPRERRVTNHAIVALVGNTIRQTRCSTCDAEHEYKDGKAPKKRSRTGSDGSDLAGGVLVTPKPPLNGEATDVEVTLTAAPASNGASDDVAATPPAETAADGNGDPEPPAGPAHDAWL